MRRLASPHSTNPMVNSGSPIIRSLRLRSAYPLQNSSHPGYGVAEFSADLRQCRNRSAIVVVSTLGYNVQSGVGVDEVNVNACMAAQGWQQTPPSVSGIATL